ncbi:MAG: methyltransferase domain-containing protein, partial [Flavobacteriaceae bacterium]|nr:methyltransferase domain-containing protein [Flavobacteriaceae bacterium]
WKLANFNAGQTILDLGCGPGFCSKELAFMVGNEGRVIGVDKSEHFIHFLNNLKDQYALNIEAQQADFNDMILQPNSLDGMYCRWALAWIPNPKEILLKVYDAMKPGGRMIIHEYYDWSTLQTEPRKSGLANAIASCLRSFKESEGEIDIGRELPILLEEIGLRVTSTRFMLKLAMPSDFNWQWPKTFFRSYFPRLIETNYLNESEVRSALKEMDELEKTKGATLCTPLMVEVIAEKI